MASEKYKVPYEILFRLNEQGIVLGCHRKDLELWVDTSTGKVENAKELDPVSIDSGSAMTAVLGQINASLAASLSLRETELAAKIAELQELQQLYITLQQQFMEANQQTLEAINENVS